MVDVTTSTVAISEADADTLLVFVFEDNRDFGAATAAVNAALDDLISTLMDTGEFTGKSGQVLPIYTRGALTAKRVILVGLGAPDAFDAETLRRASAAGARKASELKAVTIGTPLAGTGAGRLNAVQSAQALTEGVLLALYTYRGQKTGEAPAETVTTVLLLAEDDTAKSDADAGSKRGVAFAAGGRLARDLVNLPANICTPSYMAERAQEMAENTGLKCEVLGKQQIAALKMGAFLGVAQGSETPPRFIILEHNADKSDELDTVVLVGKGVTFDTGGYSLKSRDGMVGMKADMGGGAAVIGAMGIVAGLDLPLHVVGLVPAADNMVSGKAYRPQDVITASNGTTIEIISTDAEGRLLLADSLVYAKRYKPAAVVDIATLTGSCVVALGSAAAGLFSIDETLTQVVKTAADATGERVWQLPLYPEYTQAIESDTADVKNTGGRMGGVGTSAAFLKTFVDYPTWAHIDMAGMMKDQKGNPYIPAQGASGYGARLLAAVAEAWANQ